MNKKTFFGKIGQVAMMMGMPALDGNIVLLVMSGLFDYSNVPTIGLTIMSGPAAMIRAGMLDVGTKERVIVSILAGLVATIAVIFAAVLGPKIFAYIDMEVMKIIGGAAIMIIGLMVAGINIPSMVPLIVVITGFILSFLIKLY